MFAYVHKKRCPKHPTMRAFIEKLQHEEALQRVNIIQVSIGTFQIGVKYSYRRRGQTLHTIVQDFANRQPLDYLRAIGRTMTFN